MVANKVGGYQIGGDDREPLLGVRTEAELAGLVGDTAFCRGQQELHHLAAEILQQFLQTV